MGNISNLKSEDVVRTHMSYYLKNEATNWYDSELTSLEKEARYVCSPLNKELTEAIPPYRHHL